MRGPELLWKADSWDGWHATTPMKNLYVGAGGVLWGLDRLRRRGYPETKLDLPALSLLTLERFRERPDFMRGVPLPEQRESSLACGLAGILFVAWRLTGEGALADELHALVRANVDNEVEEVMWGAPGTLIVARAMAEATCEAR